MTTGEMLYLALVVATFVGFAAALAHQSHKHATSRRGNTSPG